MLFFFSRSPVLVISPSRNSVESYMLYYPTIQRSGNIDSNQMVYMSIFYMSIRNVFWFNASQMTLGHRQRGSLSSMLLVCILIPTLAWISSGALLQSWVPKTGQELLVQCGIKRLEAQISLLKVYEGVETTWNTHINAVNYFAVNLFQLIAQKSLGYMLDFWSQCWYSMDK